jgi:hypothetical protein
MSTFTIPRKEIVKPSAAHVKELDTGRGVDSSWDTAEDGQSKRKHMGVGAGATGWALSDRFDRMLPPHKRYFGRSRRTLLIGILVAFLCLLALIVGLAVGLNGSKKYDRVHLFSLAHANEPSQNSKSPTSRRSRDIYRRPHILQPRPWRLRYYFIRQGCCCRGVALHFRCGAERQ